MLRAVSKSRLGLGICWPVGWVKLESHTGNCQRCGYPYLGSAEQCSGPAPALQDYNFNNFLAFAQAAFDAKFGAILAEKILGAISKHL